MFVLNTSRKRAAGALALLGVGWLRFYWRLPSRACRSANCWSYAIGISQAFRSTSLSWIFDVQHFELPWTACPSWAPWGGVLASKPSCNCWYNVGARVVGWSLMFGVYWIRVLLALALLWRLRWLGYVECLWRLFVCVMSATPPGSSCLVLSFHGSSLGSRMQSKVCKRVLQ